MSKRDTSVSFGIFSLSGMTVFTLILLVLKFTLFPTMPYWVVCSPLIAWAIVVGGILAFGLTVLAVTTLIAGLIIIAAILSGTNIR